MVPNPEELKETTLVVVGDDRAFWACRGDKITNVHDLANCVEDLSHEEFAHHVNAEGKNDFAVWVHDVLHNPNLAADLNLEPNVTNKEHFVKTLRDHVDWLQDV